MNQNILAIKNMHSREVLKTSTFFFHQLLYNQTKFLEQTLRHQNMRNNKPRNPRMLKPIDIPQRKEETHSRFWVLNSQSINNGIHLRLIQSLENSSKIIPVKTSYQTFHILNVQLKSKFLKIISVINWIWGLGSTT